MLTPHFSLRELTRSYVADRRGIDNDPVDSTVTVRLRSLCTKVLEPVRDEFGRFSPNSGFRCADLERVLTGDAWLRRGFDSFEDYLAIKSHPRGEAADFEVRGVDNADLARWIRDNLEFDQLILEFYVPGDLQSGWVHCSYREGDNRRQALTIIKGGGVRDGIIQ